MTKNKFNETSESDKQRKYAKMKQSSILKKDRNYYGQLPK